MAELTPAYLGSSTQPVDLSLDEVEDGRIAVVQGALERLGVLEEIRCAALEAISVLSSATIAQAVQEHGFERIHDLVPPAAVRDLLRLLALAFSPLAVPIVSLLAKTLRTPSDELFVAQQAWVRIMMPEDILALNRPMFDGQLGHAVAHNPHRDPWFSQSIDTINAWAAIGPVSHGNSVLVYPDVWRQPMERAGQTVAPGQPLGVPVSFEMAPGDVLFFSGEHVHSSEINVTTKTRFVMSFRLTIRPPRPGEGRSEAEFHRVAL
ncbi:MAG TPA: phytanoyl-CoA dioxygenase family protein [Longimicrobiaceae bacterium]|nr:phytanoyl-CoA dioxygenase family protein [Longimicrobiaceae bacterium]